MTSYRESIERLSFCGVTKVLRSMLGNMLSESRGTRAIIFLGPCYRFSKIVLLPGSRHLMLAQWGFLFWHSGTADASTPTCVLVFLLAGDTSLTRHESHDARFIIPNKIRLCHGTYYAP